MPYLGEIASLITAVCWSANAVLFVRAGRRVGSTAVNAVRLGVALVVMFLLHLALLGTWFPVHAGLARFAWLGVSGLIGFSLGDAFLFEAYVLLGARLTALVFTLWPVLAALMAWACLGQRMGLAKAAAMGVTLGGIAMVVAEKSQAQPGQGKPRRFVLGLALALGGAGGQAVGFVFSKVGHGRGLQPRQRQPHPGLRRARWPCGPGSPCRGELALNCRKLKDGHAAMLIGLGALSGPVVGVVHEPVRHQPRPLPGGGLHHHVAVAGDAAALLGVRGEGAGGIPGHGRDRPRHRRGRGPVLPVSAGQAVCPGLK